MITSYPVCAYCFKDVEPGQVCNCKLSLGKPQKVLTRYKDSLDGNASDYDLDIVGEKDKAAKDMDMIVGGAFVGARIILSPDVLMCDKCQKNFEEVCEVIAEIINGCCPEHFIVEGKG